MTEQEPQQHCTACVGTANVLTPIELTPFKHHQAGLQYLRRSVFHPQLYTLGQICASMVVKIMGERMIVEQNASMNTLSLKYADDVTGCQTTDKDDKLQGCHNAYVSS